MNENDLMNNDTSERGTYHATTNLNTAIENPQINMNSVVGVNIKNVDATIANSYDDSNDNYINYQNENMVNYNNSAMLNLEDNHQDFTTSVDNSMNNSNLNIKNSQFIPNHQEVSYEPTFGKGSNVSYEPTMEEKKRPDSNLKISREFKMVLFILFILFIFLLIIPYIYDFLQKLVLEF